MGYCIFSFDNPLALPDERMEESFLGLVFAISFFDPDSREPLLGILSSGKNCVKNMLCYVMDTFMPRTGVENNILL
jgi:hypothetical protein